MLSSSVVKVITKLTPQLQSHGCRLSDKPASGVVVALAPTSALVLTAGHVVNPLWSQIRHDSAPQLGVPAHSFEYLGAAFGYEVETFEGERLAAECVAYAPQITLDLGLLRVQGKELEAKLERLPIANVPHLSYPLLLKLVGYPGGEFTVLDAQFFSEEGGLGHDVSKRILTEECRLAVGFSGGAILANNALVGIITNSSRIVGSDITRASGPSYKAIRAQLGFWSAEARQSLRSLIAGCL